MHELDNYRAKRKARIEYKRVDEPLRDGQDYHFRAEIESTRDDWANLLVIVIDEGQANPDDLIKFMFCKSEKSSSWTPTRKLKVHTATVGQLGRWIAHFLWKEVPPF